MPVDSTAAASPRETARSSDSSAQSWLTRSSKVKFGLILGLWTTLGCVSALQVHMRMRMAGRPYPLAKAFFAEIPFMWLFALVTPGILWLGRRFPITASTWARNLPVHLLGVCAAGIITKGGWDLLILPRLDPAKVPTTFAAAVGSIFSAADYIILQYIVVLLCQQAWTYYRRYQDGLVRQSRLEAQLAGAQLQALKMQLHPHFLFNTLNAISELIHENPAAAERMIARLSEFLRLTLDQGGVTEVSLAQELDFLRRYLEIEKVRFEDRLQVDFQVDPAALPAAVPNFLLQPLIENALRHGVSRKAGSGHVVIACNRVNGLLHVAVMDNGPGLDADPARRQKLGIGLGNTRERLERLYGREHRLELGNGKLGGCQVTVEIPFRPYQRSGAIGGQTGEFRSS